MPEHGKPSTYSNHRCRCDLCRVAWNAYIRGRNAVRKETKQYDHGTDGGYNLGCRCPDCSSARFLTGKSSRLRRRISQVPDGIEVPFATDACNICGVLASETRGGLVLDHIHDTSSVRGYLCNGCNTGLGKLGDSEEGLLRALAYLRKEPFDVSAFGAVPARGHVPNDTSCAHGHLWSDGNVKFANVKDKMSSSGYRKVRFCASCYRATDLRRREKKKRAALESRD